MNRSNQSIEQALRTALNGRVAMLDGASLDRLRQSRRAALAAMPPIPWYRRWRLRDPQPALAVALTLVLVVLLTPLLPLDPVDTPATASGVAAAWVSDAAILGLDEGVDLYDEWDYLRWLDQGAPLAAVMPE